MAIATTLARKARMAPVGTSAAFYITGLEASTAALVNESVQVAPRARQITDAAASRIEKAQRASGSFADRSGRTRDSIENTPETHPDGYARSIGPTHYVSRFLIFGTVKMSPKWDLFGESQPGIDWWDREMSNVSTL